MIQFPHVIQIRPSSERFCEGGCGRRKSEKGPPPEPSTWRGICRTCWARYNSRITKGKSDRKKPTKTTTMRGALA